MGRCAAKTVWCRRNNLDGRPRRLTVCRARRPLSSLAPRYPPKWPRDPCTIPCTGHERRPRLRHIQGHVGVRTGVCTCCARAKLPPSPTMSAFLRYLAPSHCAPRVHGKPPFTLFFFSFLLASGIDPRLSLDKVLANTCGYKYWWIGPAFEDLPRCYSTNVMPPALLGETMEMIKPAAGILLLLSRLTCSAWK